MRGKREKLTRTASLLAVSFVLSWLESFVPLRLLFPIPGLKLGLANIAVTATLFTVGKGAALSLVLLRPLLSLLLFGNITGSILSLCGGLLAFAAVLTALPLYRKTLSLGGISALSAVFHGLGQCIAACFLMKNGAILLYAPLLCAASSLTGLCTGWMMNAALSPFMPKIIPKQEEL